MYGIYSTNLRDKFQLIINIVSFIDFNDTFEDESRLLKKYKDKKAAYLFGQSIHLVTQKNNSEEIEEYLKGGKINFRYAAAFRRMKFKENPEKPGLYLRNRVDFNEISPKEADHIMGNVVKGESVSVGTFKGKVKVIENIDSTSSVSPGMVLVTKSIDPGQTQVFTQAGGLILEVGGVLSHGAILAREFGIPTVAQVNRATKIFHDGQDVVVDGTKGEVIISK